MTRDEALEFVHTVASAYGVRVTDALMDVWWNTSLSRLPLHEANEGAELLTGRAEMPKPAELNEALRRRSEFDPEYAHAQLAQARARLHVTSPKLKK